MWEVAQIVSDRYQLQQKLGDRGGRQTWLAVDLTTDDKELVIVKLLAFGGNIQWEDVKLFEREANTLKQLTHPSIPKYRDYFSLDEHTLWFGLVQEYIPGLSLKQLLEQGKRFSEQEICQIAKEVLLILIDFHALHPPLLHRDIKPSNLIWREDEKIYLVDFGAVQNQTHSEGASFTVVGTYGYAPMEQFGGRAVPASDLYALGATLIHLIAQTAPADLPHSNLKIQFRHCLNLTPQLANWLEKMTAPALEKRFRTAKQALTSLELFLVKQSSSQTEISFTGRTNPPLEGLNEPLTNSDTQIVSLPSKKPSNSKVKIHRYPRFMEIIIPSRGILDLVNTKNIIILGIVLLFSLNPLGLLFILFFFNLFYPNFKYRFLSTKLIINEQSFEINKIFLGFPERKKGNIAEIQDVSVNYQSSTKRRNKQPRESLIINTKSLTNPEQSERYSLGQGLTEEELIWLANEIRGWLVSRPTM